MSRKRHTTAVKFIVVARAIVVGVAYYLVSGLPGLTSSFVSIFAGFLAFDVIVAMPKFSLRLKHWKDMFLVLLPRLSGTALTLVLGIGLGVVFGGLTKIGLPVVVSAVLAIGVSYNIASQIKGNISNYVGMIATIALFDQIVRLEYIGEDWWYDLGGPAVQMVYATFVALVMGWFVGIVIGITTRLFLRRGYRTVKSEAYSQPLSMRSFRDVTRFGDDMVVLQLEVNDEAPVAYHTLAELDLAKAYGIHVISIYRTPQEVISPRGDDVILPTDKLTVVLPAEQATTMIALTKGSEPSEQI